MKKRLISFLLSVILLCLAGCVNPKGNDGTGVRIVLDVAKTENFSLDSKPGVLLDCPQLGSVDDAIVLDSTLIIKSGNGLYGFSLRTGGQALSFFRSGRGPGEYVNIWDFGCTPEGVFLYDIEEKQVLFFNLIGNLVRVRKLSDQSSDNPFQSLIPEPWGQGYLGKRMFGMPDVPELSSYDSEFRYVSPRGADKLRSGIKLWRQFFAGADGDLLYNRYFSNEISSITRDTITVKYSVDFIGRNVPVLDDEYAYINLLSKESSASRYATLMSNFFEDDKMFGFQFAADGVRCYALYDKDSGQCRAYRPELPSGIVQQILFHNGELIIICEESEGVLFYNYII